MPPLNPIRPWPYGKGKRSPSGPLHSLPLEPRTQIAQEMGMALEDVRVISPFVGGGFGGKIYHPQVLEAVKVARLAKKPVLLVYTREEEFFMDFFRSAAAIKIRSGITEKGKITLWDYKHYFFEARGSDTIYNVPHKLTTGYSAKRGSPVQPLATGAWRAPGANSNTFARESHIDIMAAKAGSGPG